MLDFAPWQTGDHVAQLTEALTTRYAALGRKRKGLLGRLRTYLPDFWHPYRRLYGDGYDRVADVLALFDAVTAAVEARPAALRRRDAARAADPAWFQHPRHVGVMLYVDRFAGTLRGVLDRLPYLQELGVTYVHLMPVLKPREGPNDGGYAVADYRAVDPRLGTLADLRALARALHAADMLLVLDVVMNHTAREHPWAAAARAGDPHYRGFYHLFDDRRLPDAYEATLPEVFPDVAPDNFTHVPELDAWAWTTFYPFQWDLDYANPDVFAAVFGELLFLANQGADVLRLDAVPFLWKQMGTNCQNLDGAHDVLRAYRALARIAAPGLLFKSEAIVAPDDTVRYLGTGGYAGKACDLGYNAPLMCHLWHALAAENTQLLTTMLTETPQPPDEAAWINYVRSHDDIGWGIADEDAAAVGQDGPATRRWLAAYYAGEVPPHRAEGYRFQPDARTGEARTSGTTAALAGLQHALVAGTAAEVDQAVDRVLLLYRVVFAMKGLPLLYGGDELGQLNHFGYLADPLRAADNRWVHRPPMDWAKAERRHTPGTVEHRLFHGLRRLAEVRAGLPCLHGRAGARVLATPNDRLLLVERQHGDDRMLLAANLAGRAEALPLETLPAAWRGGTVHDLLADRRVRYAGGELLLPPWGALWLQPAEAFEAEPVATPVRLRVETVVGETVCLVGAVDALGGGDPQEAAAMEADAYPVWAAEIDVPAGTRFTFRWLKKRGRRVVAWSPHAYWMEAGDPRVHALPG